jgi:hypothetical protein
MTLGAAILASLPPLFAIIVEIFNPINEAAIRPKVERDLVRFEAGRNHKHLVDAGTKMVCGAVEVGGLAPTFVAAATAGVGIIFEYVSAWIAGTYRYVDFGIIGGYVLLLLFLVIVVMSFLGGQTYFQIETTRQPWLILGKPRTLRWRGSEAVTRLIISVNALLVLLVWLTYAVLTFTEVHSSPGAGH